MEVLNLPRQVPSPCSGPGSLRGTTGTGTGGIGRCGFLIGIPKSRESKYNWENTTLKGLQCHGAGLCLGKDQVHRASPYHEDAFKSKGGIIDLASPSLSLGHIQLQNTAPIPSPKTAPGGFSTAGTRVLHHPDLQLPGCFAVMLWGTSREVSAPRLERTRVFNTPSKCCPCTRPGSSQGCSRGKDQHHFSVIYTQVGRGPAAQERPQAPRPGGH